MKCQNCSKSARYDWFYCPQCGTKLDLSQVVEDFSPSAISDGVKYFPAAFDPEPYTIGRTVAEAADFYKIYVRFILAFITDYKQLVDFRVKVITEIQKVVGKTPVEGFTKICWCAISLATDRYFADKAVLYQWDTAVEADLKNKWYELISRAFVPDVSARRLDISVLQNFKEQFVAAHRRDQGPLPACVECTSKCIYDYEVAQCLPTNVHTLDSVGSGEAVAKFSKSLCDRLVSSKEFNLDLSFCFAAHLLQAANVPDANQRDLIWPIRKTLLDKEITS